MKSIPAPTDPTSTKAWAALSQHLADMQGMQLADLLADPGRYPRFSFQLNDFCADFSRQLANEKTLALLDELGITL